MFGVNLSPAKDYYIDKYKNLAMIVSKVQKNWDNLKTEGKKSQIGYLNDI